ncbi:alkylhydroperoxidase [Niastella koreensis]|uniref:Carboxymuconolactone decarboxylase n=2 Tax=Niastella koreensis TaxID=354356 RepID=G8T7A1_NIAKG|nr:carboxymuconolactone decarboxylase family protein [Niastella koreensis]AEW00126.1 Carboxymuconolactone decarboxylase [Niastella koreensis GR20-10]OQP49568.1 alkylhydroperoxidase [Niastella koreensis]
MSDQFEVLKRENVSTKNQQVFDQIKSLLGAVPNLYSTLAYSENALEAYFRLETSPNSLSAREVAIVNLVVSEINNCMYSLSVFTMIAKQSGFTEEQTIEIRSGCASFDTQLDALIKLTRELSRKKNIETQQLLDAFYMAGYTKENLMDIIILIGDRTISNLLHTVTRVPIEFPLAKTID